MKVKPIFNVYLHDWNHVAIKVVNFFDLGPWASIKDELKKVKKAILKAKPEDYAKICSKYYIKDVDASKYLNKPEEFLKDSLECKLRIECLSYFWSRSEYEIIITDFHNRNELKVDIYQQLRNNWEIFKTIALKEIG